MLSDYRIEAVVGEMDGAVTFGRIRDVEIYDGKLFVLDMHLPGIMVFDLAGGLLEEAGRKGKGPGEFEFPAAVAASGDKVYVSEITRTVEVFTTTAEGLEPSRTVRTQGAIYDICVGGSVTFVQAWVPGTNELVHRTPGDLDAARNLVPDRSFGAFYDIRDHSATSFGHFMSEALVACDERADIVVVAPRSTIDEIRGYSFEGEPRWRLVLESFEGMKVEELPRGHQWTIPDEGYDNFYSLTRPFENQALLQVAHKTVASVNGGLDFDSLETYLLDLSTGEARYGGRGWPPIVAADSRCIVVKPNQIVPQLEIRCRRN